MPTTSFVSREARSDGSDEATHDADVGFVDLRAGAEDDTCILEEGVHVLGCLLVPSGRKPISKPEHAGV